MTSDSGEVERRLAALPLFRGLGAEAVSSIAQVAVPFDVGPGHVLVQPGLVGSGLFLIEDGHVTLTIYEKEIDLGPGSFFGELALLDDRAVRTTRVRTRTPVRGFAIDRDHFDELLHSHPTVAVEMLRVVAGRLVDLIEDIKD